MTRPRLRPTTPLLALARALLRGAQLAARGPALLRARGLGRVLQSARRIAREEGWSGLAARGRFLLGPAGGGRNDYQEWLRRHDRIDAAVRAALRERAGRLCAAPVISLLLPARAADARWLAQAVASVQAQVYQRWELCIVHEAAPAADVLRVLQGCRDEPRIRCSAVDPGGEVADLNAALALAGGDWTGILRPHDLLHEAALACMAEAIDAQPRARLAYCDEDRLGPQGQRCEPRFRCQWNRDLFYSTGSVPRLALYRCAEVRALGGFAPQPDGAAEFDLALRIVERCADDEIVHVPRVLYHARSGGDGPPDPAAACRALQQHLERRGVRAGVEVVAAGLRVRYDLPAPPPLASLVIPTRDGLPLLRRCIESVLSRTRYPAFELVVIDNGSRSTATLHYLDELRAHPRVRVLRDERPFNYSALNNRGVQAAAGEVVCLLNDDVEVIEPDWLGEMVSLALQPDIGAVGARLLYSDGRIQHAGVVLGIGGVASHVHKYLPRNDPGYLSRTVLLQSFCAVTGACLAVRKSVYLEAGGLDEASLAVAYNDVDFCLRLRARGLRNVFTPYAELFHHESASRGAEDTPEKRERFRRESECMHARWGELLRDDPAYSPNLALDALDCSLAWPPRVEPLQGSGAADAQTAQPEAASGR